MCSSLLELCVQSLKLIVYAVFVLKLVKSSPPRSLSLVKFLKSWQLQHQIPFNKHIFWSNYHLSNFIWNLYIFDVRQIYAQAKKNIWTPSEYYPFLFQFFCWNEINKKYSIKGNFKADNIAQKLFLQNLLGKEWVIIMQEISITGWSRAPIWASVALCQVEGQAKVGDEWQNFQNCLTIQDNLFLHFYLSTDGNIKTL